ncbi:DUF192 domain-containing protein [Salisediminibacterium beveridgei]|uniref:DUF192 domain-containing protein n=1 Tax=Salisediminibacterium beveridgei TaxID=632773 RepID=A0A1D7QXY0_9BACI|nr:DUF192 domain-containing protein [Salisediminibacterium beveridgei]AOM83866.1 hypothetical protein BBEV_2527 [Salisediminibacterium beveridgei]
MKVIRKDNGQLIANDVRRAETFWSRLRGLTFTKAVNEQSGLYLSPCRSIHTWFMKIPIDVVYLDAEDVVVATECSLAPWKMGMHAKGAKKVVELAEGKVTAEKIQPGQQWLLEA